MNRAMTKIVFSLCSVVLIFHIAEIVPYGRIFSSNSELNFEIFSRLKGPLSPDDQQLLSIVSKKYLIAPSTKPYNFSKSKHRLSSDLVFLNSVEKSNSWSLIRKEILKLYPVGSKENGFFIEAGAFDGEFLSNTLYLELQLNWTGLLVEPDKSSYLTLLTKHRRAWSCNCCLSYNNYPYETVLVQMTKFGEKILNAVDGSRHYDGLTSGSKYKTYDNVMCFPLQTLLKSLKRKHVDLISLDIEGGEEHVLKNFPWNEIRVDVWIIEHPHRLTDPYSGVDWVDEEFVKRFIENGYVLLKSLPHHPIDYIFLMKNSTYYAENFMRLGIPNN